MRFYCGTPLIASNGHRLGTLCFADNEPHSFDAERCNILNNMAELCVREIEREYMLRAQRQKPSELELVRALPLLLLCKAVPSMPAVPIPASLIVLLNVVCSIQTKLNVLP